MVRKSFYCHRCERRIPISPARRGDIQGAIRQHYWDHHRPTMMKGKAKRSPQYHVGSVTSMPRKGVRRKVKTTRVVLTEADVKRGEKRRRKQWKK